MIVFMAQSLQWTYRESNPGSRLIRPLYYHYTIRPHTSGGVRTHEAYAGDLKSPPFDHSGTLVLFFLATIYSIVIFICISQFIHSISNLTIKKYIYSKLFIYHLFFSQITPNALVLDPTSFLVVHVN